jgi:hypothetical protein
VASGDVQEGRRALPVEKMRNQNRAISIRRFRKSGQFKVRTLLSQNPILAAFWWYVRRSELTDFIRGEKGEKGQTGESLYNSVQKLWSPSRLLTA